MDSKAKLIPPRLPFLPKRKSFANRLPFDSRDQCLPFSASDLIPLLGQLEIVEPKFALGQFFDFGFRVDARRFFNLPHPIQALRYLRDPGLSPRNLLIPLNVRFFAGCPARRTLSNGLQVHLL